MAVEKYHYSVNNRPDRFEATVESSNGTFEARTTAMGWSFEGSGETSEAALEEMKSAMDKAGWFLHRDFTRV